MGVNETSLRYAIAVYDEKRMTKAARKMFVSQPSLSQGIRLLEEELGIMLFERSKTPIRATEAGEIFVHWAKHVLASKLQMLNHLSELSEGRLRKLTIGLSSQICNEILPIVLQQFYSVTTGCAVVLKKCSSNDLISLIERDGVDLLIDRPHSKYNCIHIAEEEILLAAPASFQFSVIESGEYPTVSMSDAANMPFISLSDNGPFLALISEIFKIINSAPNIVLECPSSQVAHSMVALNIGVTLLPKCCITNNKLPNVCYYRFFDHQMSHSVTALHREDRPLTKDAHIFISILKDKFADCAVADSAMSEILTGE